MFPTKQPNQVHKKSEDNCEIEIKKTNQGKKIRFKGKCSKEQISFLRQENGIEE